MITKSFLLCFLSKCLVCLCKGLWQKFKRTKVVGVGGRWSVTTFNKFIMFSGLYPSINTLQDDNSQGMNIQQWFPSLNCKLWLNASNRCELVFQGYYFLIWEYWRYAIKYNTKVEDFLVWICTIRWNANISNVLFSLSLVEHLN